MKPARTIFLFLLLITFMAFSITPALVRKVLSKQVAQSLNMAEEEKTEKEKEDTSDAEGSYLPSGALSWSSAYATILELRFIQLHFYCPETHTPISTPPPQC